MMKSKCYQYKQGILLLDVIIDEKFQNIDLMDFCVPNENEPKGNWQVPYMEQYFELDSDRKLCDTYDEPDPELSPVRILFFIYESSGSILKTPFGDVDLLKVEELPESIEAEIEFEDDEDDEVYWPVNQELKGLK